MHLFSKTLVAACSLTVAATFAFASPAAALDDQQKKEMGDFIKSYLIEHPEIMLDVQAALEKKQENARLAQSSKAITDNADAIFHAKDDMTIGNPKGDVTVVEFFDYNCGYCRHALPDMEALLKKDKNIRFVLKEFPILGPDSVAATRVSDAFKKIAPEKYPDFHRALLGSDGKADAASAIAVAEKLGVGAAEIKKEMQSHSDTAAINQSYQLATDLGLTGTPSYVLGNEAISGAIGLDALEEKIANIRACGKTAC